MTHGTQTSRLYETFIVSLVVKGVAVNLLLLCSTEILVIKSALGSKCIIKVGRI